MPEEHHSKPLKLLSKSVLRGTWDLARSSGKRFRAKGIDGQTGEDFAANLDDNLRRIAKALGSGDYKFRDLRGRWIPKKGNSNKERLICIPTVSDRVVQRAIAKILETGDRLGTKNTVSFGFQEGLGVNHAIDRALELRNSQCNWAIKTDVVSFFDAISRPQLKSRISRVAPRSLAPLIEQVIDCEVHSTSNLELAKLEKNGIRRGRGLRQGMPLSPLLSNFELREFDRKVERSGLKLVRYADDIVAFCESRTSARATLALLGMWLRELDHSIPAIEEKNKTFIVPPEEGVEFLGFDIRFCQNSGRYEPFLPESTIENILSQIRGMATIAQCEQEKWDFGSFVKGVTSRNSSLLATYSRAKNVSSFRTRLFQETNKATRALLTEVFGAGALGNISDRKLRFLGVKELND